MVFTVSYVRCMTDMLMICYLYILSTVHFVINPHIYINGLFTIVYIYTT